MSEYTYELKQSFKYAKSGEQEDATFITITAPNYDQLLKAAPIKQAFMAAARQVTSDGDDDKDKEKPTDAKITGQQCIQLLYNWDGDMVKVLVYAQELFKSGVALVDGEAKLNIELIKKMSAADFEGLVGAYIANFIAPSLMDGQ